MGIICSSEKKKTSSSKYAEDDLKKTAIQSLQQQQAPIELLSGPDEDLRFKVQLDTIKARNLPSSASYVKVKFGKEKEFMTSRDNVYGATHSWNMKQDFDFNTTRKSLRIQAIELTLHDGYDQIIGSVGIRLHDIVTGPPEQDFPLSMNKGYKEQTRLNFPVKMYQMISICVKPKQVTCKLDEGLKEKFYNYSLKLKTKEREFLSEHSANFRNPSATIMLASEKLAESENYQYNTMDENKNLKIREFVSNPMDINEERKSVVTPQDSLENSTVDRNLTRSMLTQSTTDKSRALNASLSLPSVKKDMTWEENTEDSTQGANLEIEVCMRELTSGNFQFFLWSCREGDVPNVNAPDDADESKEIYIDHKLVAECYITMTKFFFHQAEMNFGEDNFKAPGIPGKEENSEEPKKSGQTRVSKFKEKLWHQGKAVGEMVGEFTLKNTSFYRQMIIGVRNETGIQKVGSMYNMSKESAASLGNGKSADVKEIQKLEGYKEEFKSILLNLSKANIVPKTRVKLMDDLREVLHYSAKTLRNLNQNFALSFVDSNDNLLATQRTLIHLAKNYMEYCEEVVITIRPMVYENLTLLINRSEFDLNCMGFGDSSNAKGQNKLDAKLYQKKIDICLEFEALLLLMLGKVQPKINDKGLPEKEKEFVENFVAHAYFKIPEFRKKLLTWVTKEDEKLPIQEWRGAEWVIDERPESQKIQYFASMFDWEKNFYGHIKNTEGGQNNYETLRKILEDKELQEKISKKGVAFYLFLTEWANQVERTIVTKEQVPWPDIPGYTTLIKSFLLDLKTKDVRRYPEAMVQASCSLLRNDKLLNTFVPIIYQKTRIYDSSNVFGVFELINKWFETFTENNKSIPSTFDYSFFFKGLLIVLDGDHALNIAIVLLVIYNNFNLIPSSEKGFISDYLLNKSFFKFFMHWSWSVRQVFHHLLLYRFYHQHREANTNLTNLDDLRKEFLLYNQKRETLASTKKLLVNDFINMAYSRNMTIVENAYQKFSEEKKMQELQKRFKTKLKPLPKLRYASESNLTSFLKPGDLDDSNQNLIKNNGGATPSSSTLRQTEVNSALPRANNYTDDDFTAPRKGTYDPKADPNCYILNPDKIESSKEDSILVRPTRSESVSFNPIKGILDDEGGAKVKANLQANNSKVPEGKYEKTTEKKKVILRRFMYFDKSTNDFKEIPKEYIVYLQTAYQEFEKTKEQYLKWLNPDNNCNAIVGVIQPAPTQLKVPELIVKIPLDDNEAGQIEPESW